MSNNIHKYQHITKRDYEAVAGPDWPSFELFQKHEHVADFVYHEIDQMLQGPPKFENQAFCVMPFYSIELPDNIACCLLQKPFDLEQVRQHMLLGQRPDACNKCWNLEDAGFKSDRQIKNETLDWYCDQDIFSMFEKCQQGHNQIIHYKIDTSNTCNGTCVTCSSHHSSLWAQLEQRQGLTGKPNWSLTLDQISHQIDFDTAASIGFRGGEPLLSATNFHVLEQLIQHGNTDCFVNFTTNGSVSLSHEQKRLLSKFPNLNMCFSIDGTDLVFEYLRYPLKWSQVLKNINECADHGIMTSASFTVSNLNVLYFSQIIEWFEDNDMRYLVNPVYTPAWFGISALPRVVKDKIMNAHQGLDTHGITQFLAKHTDQDEALYQMFRQEIAKQDRWKGIHMRDYLPELANLIG